MKHTYYFPVVLLTVLVFVFSGCNSLKEPELKSLEIEELSRTAGEGLLKVRLTYFNPNKKPLTIKKVDVDAVINQKSIGNYTLPQRGKINKLSEEAIEMSFAFNPDNIYSGFLSKQFGAIGSKRVRISLTGDVVFISQDSELELPLEYSEVYKIPE